MAVKGGPRKSGGGQRPQWQIDERGESNIRVIGGKGTGPTAGEIRAMGMAARKSGKSK